MGDKNITFDLYYIFIKIPVINNKLLHLLKMTGLFNIKKMRKKHLIKNSINGYKIIINNKNKQLSSIQFAHEIVSGNKLK